MYQLFVMNVSRWTGFGMGLDLIVTYNMGYISLKRNLGISASSAGGGGGAGAGGEHEALLSNHKKRHVFYRVTVVSLNDQKQVHGNKPYLPKGGVRYEF